MTSRSSGTVLQLTVLALFAAGAALFVSDRPLAANPAPQPTPKKPKYSEFPHATKAHGIECSSCHKFPSSNWNKVRTGDAAFPDVTEYPRHESCLKCHTQQFFRGSPPAICSICHTNPSPRNSSRHPFPNPREIFDNSPKGKPHRSDFAIQFPHDKHIEIVSAHKRSGAAFIRASYVDQPEASCAVCHQTVAPQGKSDDEYLTKPPADLGDKFWLKKGTFKSTPLGHTTCFTCHSADTGIQPEPQTCSTCHKLRPMEPAADLDLKLAAVIGIQQKPMRDAWAKRDSSGTFRHEFFAHEELACATCHNVTAMNTLDAATKRVPVTACATCHATPTSDDGGALNFEIDKRKSDARFTCVKCHLVLGRMPVPKSHTDAVAAAAGK